jgi:hypothetical protein
MQEEALDSSIATNTQEETAAIISSAVLNLLRCKSTSRDTLLGRSRPSLMSFLYCILSCCCLVLQSAAICCNLLLQSAAVWCCLVLSSAVYYCLVLSAAAA